jgi:hypothetical protein
MAKVLAELVNDFRTPSFLLLPEKNLFADPPVRKNQLPVHGQGGPNLRSADSALQQGQEILVALRTGDQIRHGHPCSTR